MPISPVPAGPGPNPIEDAWAAPAVPRLLAATVAATVISLAVVRMRMSPNRRRRSHLTSPAQPEANTTLSQHLGGATGGDPRPSRRRDGSGGLTALAHAAGVERHEHVAADDRHLV